MLPTKTLAPSQYKLKSLRLVTKAFNMRNNYLLYSRELSFAHL